MGTSYCISYNLALTSNQLFAGNDRGTVFHLRTGHLRQCSLIGYKSISLARAYASSCLLARSRLRRITTVYTRTTLINGTPTRLIQRQHRAIRRMSDNTAYSSGTVTAVYKCFHCGHSSTVRGLQRSTYPLWQHKLRCQHCQTQPIEGTWQEYPDSYGL